MAATTLGSQVGCLRTILMVAVFLLFISGRIGTSASASSYGSTPSVSPALGVSVPTGEAPNAAGIYSATSQNWEGYVVTGASVEDVQGSWYVPSVACSQIPSSVSSSWIGIDGWGSNTVEQIGTISSCDGYAASYAPWYEFWPQIYRTNIPDSIEPGDMITARVSTTNGVYYLSECDVTRNWCYQTSGTVNGGAADISAEWITEAYSFCTPTCTEQPLANYRHAYYGSSFTGSVTTDYARIGQSSGSISSFAGIAGDTVYNVEMSGCPSGCPAVTSELLPDGTSFYTSWTSTPTPRSIGIAVSPNPISASLGSTVAFTVTVTDNGGGASTSPTGSVSWNAGIAGGGFAASTCTLTAVSSTTSSCEISYTAPSTVGAGAIIASYAGDTVHSAGYATSSLTVSMATLTINYLVQGGGSGYSPPVLTYSLNGAVQTATLSTSKSTFNVDPGSAWNVNNILGGSTSVEKWQTVQAASGIVSSPQNVTLVYYHQFLISFAYTIIGEGTGYANPSVTYTKYGIGASATSGSSVWVDSGSSYSYPAQLSGSSSSERWYTPSTMGSVSASETVNAGYYHQYFVTFTMDVQGGGSGYSAPTVSYGSFGSGASTSIGTGVWADAGSSYSYTNPLPGSSSNERWYAGQQARGMVSSAGSVNAVYFHQSSVTVSYSLVGGGNPTVPVFNGTQFGQAIAISLTENPTTFWLDSGSKWQVPNPLGGSTALERWVTVQTNGTITQSMVTDLNYTHQYFLTLSLAPAGGGSVNLQNGWHQAGSSIEVVATANPGWKFEGWTGTGSGSSSVASNSTSLIFSSPIIASAVFYPGLTITAGSGGSVAYSAEPSASLMGDTQGSSTSTIYAPFGTTVALQGNPSSFLYEFTGWVGGASGTSGDVSVTLNAPTAVEANFSYNYLNIGVIVVAIIAIVAFAVLVQRRRGVLRKQPVFDRVATQATSGRIRS